ncbi:MAG: D-alanyl-D-alanine carboxypeptidase/D-alanyl-D-alanine-endopeptidase [Gemmatimonadota bacterium]
MGVIALLQPDARISAQVAETLTAASHQVLPCQSWEAVRTLLENEAIDTVVADADFPNPGAAVRSLRATRARSAVGLVVWTEEDTAERYFDLGEAGVDGVLGPRSRPSTIRSRVANAIAETRGRRIRAMLPESWPDKAAEALHWAVAHGDRRGSVQGLASAMGMSPSALQALLREEGLPTPNRLLLWGRLVLAAACLADPSKTSESVAYSVGYATAGAFSRAMKTQTGFSPGQLRIPDAMRVVLRKLIERHLNGGEAGTTFTSIPSSLGGTLLLAIALTAGGCAAGPGVDRGAVEEILRAPPMDQLHAGVLAIDAATGRTLYAHNERRRFIPASNQKVLVTATALSLLGPDYRFETTVRALGEQSGDVLDGDLVIEPSGDPSWSDRYWADGKEVLAALADSVRAAGIRTVTGGIRIDATAWDSTTIGPTWEFEDLRYGYGATGSVLAMDEGEVEVILRAGDRPGLPVDVAWSVGGPDYVRARIETVHSDSTRRVRASYLPESRRLILEGRIPAGGVDTLSVAQRDPMGVVVRELSNAFVSAGIEVSGDWTIQWDAESVPRGCPQAIRPRCSAPIATLRSPPLSELVAGVLEPSQNWMTEQLVRTLGALYGERGSWSEGTDVMTRYLVDSLGVAETDISARDGSGLSAYNLVTPRAVVRILRAMADGPYSAEFRSAMAEPGEEDSTLEERLEDLDGRVFAKTGTISNVNSLSGYLVGPNGHDVIFSILTNASGLPASRVRPVIDDILRALADSPRSTRQND